MSVHIEQCTTLDAEPVNVWDLIEDITSHSRWMRDAVEITMLNNRRGGIGAEFSCLTRVGPFHERDLMRVTEWQPSRTMAIEHLGAVRGNARFTLTAASAGTRFCWNEQLRFPWWMGGVIGERIAKPVLGHIWRGNLARLQRLVETG